MVYFGMVFTLCNQSGRGEPETRRLDQAAGFRCRKGKRLLDGVAITWKFLYLLFPIGCLLIFNIGIGLILSALFVFFRDMQYLWSVFIQLLMYLSAIFYTTDGYAPSLQVMFYLNPIYLFITYFRQIVLGCTVPPLWFHLLILFYVAVTLVGGVNIYKKHDDQFLYYV